MFVVVTKINLCCAFYCFVHPLCRAGKL